MIVNSCRCWFGSVVFYVIVIIIMAVIVYVYVHVHVSVCLSVYVLIGCLNFRSFNWAQPMLLLGTNSALANGLLVVVSINSDQF